MTNSVLPRLACVAAMCVVGAAASAQTIRSQLVASGMSQPVGVYAPTGDTSRIFILEQTGRIRILTLGTNALQSSASPFLNVTALISTGGERGLLGLAFDPEYATNGFFYVNYTNLAGNTVIARYTANPPFATSTSANAGSAVIMRTITQDFANHNGGHLAFGPDRMLYVAMGDGGSANDPNNRAQNDGSLLGKMLRLDVRDTSAADGDDTYIPNNNPFRGGGNPLDEIWSKGLRNPWKFSFDRLTGDMYIGDVGQDAREEIDFQPAVQLSNPADGNSTITNAAAAAGRNYGWRCMEGTVCTGLSGCTCNAGTLTMPIIDVNHNTGVCSITGGVVYRGTQIAGLQGAYFYSDYCANWIRSLRYTGGTVSDQVDWTAQLATPTGNIGSVVAFGEDATGEVYIISIAGSVYKIVEGTTCGCPCEISAADTAIYSYNFQTDAGWTVSAPGTGAATDGLWQRGVPVNDGANTFDPIADSDGSGACWVTENAVINAGNIGSDVDGGTTYLLSPALDLVAGGGGNSGGQVTVCYDYYAYLSAPGGGDGVFVDISSNGAAGPWVRIATHPSSNFTRWTPHAVTQSELTAAGVAITNNMRLRFSASDISPDASVEAGIDNVKIYRRIPITDCNNNGIADATDLFNGTSQDCNNNTVPDECDLANGTFEDYDGGPVGVRTAGDTFFNTSCFGCHGTAGTGGTGPNIRNESRTTIRNRLTLAIPHPGGGFPGATDQDFANLEAYLADFGSRGRPDRIPDVCQPLFDCDNDGFKDGKELELGTQVDLDYNGLPDQCECAGWPQITIQPDGGPRRDPGSNVTLQIVTNTLLPTAYQWKRNGVPLSNGAQPSGSAISGAAAATLLISNAQFPDSGNYSVTLTSAICGTVDSTTAIVRVNCVSDTDDGSATGIPDGGTGIEDLLYYLGIYDVGNPGADVDDGSGLGVPDGGIGIEDLLYYLDRYDAGC